MQIDNTHLVKPPSRIDIINKRKGNATRNKRKYKPVNHKKMDEFRGILFNSINLDVRV